MCVDLSISLTALHMASENGHAIIMHALLDAGDDVEAADWTKKIVFVRSFRMSHFCIIFLDKYYYSICSLF